MFLLALGVAGIVVWGALGWAARLLRWMQPVAALTGAPRPWELPAAEAPASLKGRIHNVFGDAVPYAKVAVGPYLVQAGPGGEFRLGGLRAGPVDVLVLAAGYRPRKFPVQLDEGENVLFLKYETGLFPEDFAADFHVFENRSSDGRWELFGTFGFANGTREVYYLYSLDVLDAADRVLLQLLKEKVNFEQLPRESSDVYVEWEPRPSLGLKPGGRFTGELPPLPVNKRGEVYQLRAVIASAEQRSREEYVVLLLHDPAELDNDWDPHVP